MHAEATKHVLLGRKSLGCPAGKAAAVGTIGEASQPEGLNITKWLQSRKDTPHEIVLTGRRGKPTSIVYGGRPKTWRKNQADALHGTRRDRGPGSREGFAE